MRTGRLRAGSGRYALHARLLWRAAPAHSLACLALTAVSAAVNTASLISTGRLVGALPDAIADGAGSAAATQAWRWLVVTAVLFVAGPVTDAARQPLAEIVSARYFRLTFDMVVEAGTAPHGIAHLEDPAVAGRMDALVEAIRDSTFALGVERTWTIIGTRLTGIGAFVVLASWRWWAPLVAAGSYLVLSRVFTAWIATVFDDLLDVTGNQRRRATYVRSLLMNAPAAKELRLFGMVGWLVDRYTTAWREAMVMVWRNRTRSLGPIMVTSVGMLVANAAILALLAYDASAGAVSLASLVTLVQALLALEAFGPLGDQQTALARNTSAMATLAELRSDLGLPALPQEGAEDRAGRIPGSPGSATASTDDKATPDTHERATPVAESMTSARGHAVPIALRDVTFTYPSREEATFERLSIDIPAGQSVALVGANGAGKSTLIKLLCGLYPPDSGTVRIEGGDPAYDEATRRKVAVIFQDFVRYHLPLRDNIGFGSLTHHDDHDVLERALADAGGTALMARLDHGWDTVLSPAYTNGTELSGGQWQRVALARALAAVAGGAGVLVLDEPTAALDVRAEAALFDRFLDVTRGMTTLLVSHRLSSVRHADRIVVLGTDPDDPRSGVRLVEDGSHDELMAAGGTYAEMFSLQARRFAAAGGDGTR
jgi:ATP-binding cassette, subfamily B, bacterial